MRSDLPTLNLLRAFEAAGQHLSFKLAAEQLFITPSAVSQQIKTLEEQLGIELFVRGNRELSFTETGRNYWQTIHKHINGIREATASLKSDQEQEILTVSMMPPVAKRVVLPKLAEFHALYPNIDLRIETSINNTNLNSGAADLAVRFGTPPWGGLIHEKLINTYIQLICPPSFTETYKLDNDAQNVLNIPYIQMTGRPDAWRLWFAQLGSGNYTPTGKAFHVDDYPAAIEAAETLGAALALIPLENPLIHSGRVEAPFPAIGPLDESIYAVYPESQKSRPVIRTFVDWLLKELRSL